jgi:hypothetical protein
MVHIIWIHIKKGNRTYKKKNRISCIVSMSRNRYTKKIPHSTDTDYILNSVFEQNIALCFSPFMQKLS